MGSFSARALRGYLPEITQLTERAMSTLRFTAASRVEIYTWAKSLALRIAARVFVGTDLGADSEDMNDALKAILALPGARFPLALPGTRLHRGRRGLAHARAYFASRIEARTLAAPSATVVWMSCPQA